MRPCQGPVTLPRRWWDNRVAVTQDRGITATGRLPDGTSYFAPLGELVYDSDDDRVQCHLCGGWFRFVGSAHLRLTHGWTLDRYRQAFYLLRETPTCARGMSEALRVHAAKRRAAGEFVGKPGRHGTRGRGVRRERSLGAVLPALVAELHPDLNGELDPFRVGVRSGRPVWWLCRQCGTTWQAPPHGRSNGEGCPTCGREQATLKNSRVSKERSLAIRRPDLLAEWHPVRNEDVDPYSVAARSGRKIWWRCAVCGHEWQATPDSRSRGRGCPDCGRRQAGEAIRTRLSVVAPHRSIAVKRPDLALELHPTRNVDVDPLTLAAYSNQTVWWGCRKCAQEWQAKPCDRSRERARCPRCNPPKRVAA